MNIYLILASYLAIYSFSLSGAEIVSLDESLLTKEVSEQINPSIDQINTAFYQAEKALSQVEENFSVNAYAKASQFKSSERLLSNFDGGVTQSALQYELGLKKNFKQGFQVGVGGFGSKISNAFINDASTQGVNLSLSIDLLKNLFGRTTLKQLEKTELGVKRAKIEKTLKSKTFLQNVRKLYWGLVANNEQRKILTQILELTKKQTTETNRRFKQGVADSGELARNKSQISLRQSNLVTLNYQRIDLIKKLKEIIPTFNGQKLELKNYNSEDFKTEILKCTGKIQSFSKTPNEFSSYSGVLALLNQEQSLEKAINKTHNYADIKLRGEYALVGRGFGFNDSREDFFDSGRARRSVGVEINLPLGGQFNKTKKINKMIIDARYRSEAQGYRSKMDAFHSETTRLIDTLQEVLKNQSSTNFHLSKSIRESRKKFKQARISLQELILEEDTFLQTKMNEVQTNLTIVNTLLDYFSVFDRFPCEFNKGL